MPAQRLTLQLLKSLQAADRDYFVWDDTVRGFGVRVLPSGARKFVIQWREKPHGRQRRRVIGEHGVWTLEQARAEGRKLLYERSRCPADEQATTRRYVKLADFTVEWLTDRAPEHRTTGQRRSATSINNDRLNLQHHVLPILGQKYLHEITKKDVESVKTAAATVRFRSRERSNTGRGYKGPLGGPGAARRVVGTLKSVLAYAVDLELISVNPASKVKLPADAKRQIYMTNEQCKTVLRRLETARAEGVNAKSLDTIELWLRTGCRKSEIAKLRWTEVLLDQGFLHIGESKTGPKTVTLCQYAIAVLNRQDRDPRSKFVFPGDRGEGTYHQGWKKVWERLREPLGLRHIRPHDFRHTYASLLAEQGVPLQVIGQALGHKKLESTMRYAHLTEKAVRDAVQIVGDVLAKDNVSLD